MQNLPPCPECGSEYSYEDGEMLICPECAHEWAKAGADSDAEQAAAVKDSRHRRHETQIRIRQEGVTGGPSCLMIPGDVLLLFFATSIALALVPGPDNIFVLTQSALHGPRAGVLITLGLCTGLIVHTSAVALGVAAVFQSSPFAFTALKMIGGAYLMYLAWQVLQAGAQDITGPRGAPAGGWALVSRGVVMNITNPKVAVFFLAFLPQFADPARGSLPMQIFMLGAVFMLAALLVFSLIAWAASAIGRRLQASSRAQIIMNRMAGAVFVALAVRLVLSE